MAKRKYTAKFKFQVVMEVIKGRKEICQVARAYGVHPISRGAWKKEFTKHSLKGARGNTAMESINGRLKTENA